jgi:hypothetical protein
VIVNFTTRAVLAAVTLAAAAALAPRKHTVEMAITLPTGAVAHASAPEDEGVMVTLADGSRYGFVPALTPDDESRVIVSIWDVDAKPIRRLGTTTVASGGADVQSETSPVFLIRVVRVVRPK